MIDLDPGQRHRRLAPVPQDIAKIRQQPCLIPMHELAVDANDRDDGASGRRQRRPIRRHAAQAARAIRLGREHPPGAHEIGRLAEGRRHRRRPLALPDIGVLRQDAMGAAGRGEAHRRQKDQQHAKPGERHEPPNRSA
jgi:hypothetical protein